MKILCRYSSNAHHTIRMAWAHALSFCGHEFRFWYQDRQPIFDALDEFRPDIFIMTTYDLDGPVIKAIKERPEMKVAMIASDWGRQNDDLDLEKFHVLVAREDEKKMIGRLREECGKPDYVFCHYSQPAIEETHTYWKEKLGIPIFGIPCCADVFEYLGGVSIKELECDVSFCGGWWPYKGKNLNRFIAPLCYPVGRYNVKIFGNQAWSVPQYLGLLPGGWEKNLFCSTKICVNTSEPHSTIIGDENEDGPATDVIERVFKVVCAGAFILDGGYVKSLHEDFFSNGEIEYGTTQSEFLDKFDYYLKRPEERAAKIGPAREVLFAEHTCFDRAASLLGGFGLVEEESNIRQGKQKFFLDAKERSLV